MPVSICVARTEEVITSKLILSYLLDHFAVDDHGSVVSSWSQKPNEQRAFEDGVKRNEADDDAHAKLEDDQQRENHPIRQPLLVRVFALAGLDGC